MTNFHFLDVVCGRVYLKHQINKPFKKKCLCRNAGKILDAHPTFLGNGLSKRI